MSGPIPTDEALLKAWHGGDNDAGEALFARHFDRVCRFFNIRVGDDVEDLVQATFESILQRRAVLRPGGFKSHLFVMCRDQLLEFLRRTKHHDDHQNISEFSIQDFGTTPSQHVARNERGRRLIDALRRLPIDQQMALELTYWEELSGEEVADVLGISHNAVRARLTRARDRLRELLGELAPSDAEVMGMMTDMGAQFASRSEE